MAHQRTPRITDLCGLKTPDTLDGVSLVPVLKDQSKAVKTAAFTRLCYELGVFRHKSLFLEPESP